MAGPSSHGPAGSGPVPSSAIVLDFICLFTHDLKRKQKRWQDGVLKYHTFNKRIMVSDDRGHFIGDAHWQAEADIEPGDEFQLDRGAAIVQVSDCTGQREQDLTELLDKRARDVEKRRANAISRTPRSSNAAASSPAQDQSSHFQLRHRPLASLVGASPRIGRAVIPPHSPYEVRQIAQRGAQPEPSEELPPPKRRKQERSPPSKSYHARSLFGAALSLSPFPMSSPSAQSQGVGDMTSTKPKAPLLSRKLHQQPQNSSYRQLGVSPQQPAEAASFLVPAVAEQRRPLEANSSPQNDVNHSLAKREEPTRLLQSEGSLDTSEEIDSSRIISLAPSPPAALTANLQPKKLTVAPPRPCTATVQRIHNESTISKDKQSNISTLESTKHPHQSNYVTVLPPNQQNGVRPSNEPRTELRIRPRQRRGLLVMSEKHGRDKNVEKRHTVDKGVESQASSESGHLKQGNEIEKTDGHSRICGQSPPQNAPIDTNEPCREATTSVTVAGLHTLEDEASNDSGCLIILDSSSEDEPEPLQALKIKPQEDAGSMKVGDASSLTTKTRPLRDRRTRKAATRQSTSDEDSEVAALSPVPKAKGRTTTPRATASSSNAPRITKMARKSVKSREVIGFVVQCDEPMVIGGIVVAPMLATNDKVGHPTSGNVGGREAESQSHTDATPKPPVQPDSVATVAQPDSMSSNDKSKAKPTPRLSNPATRGKKAAKRKDAAGHLPQTMIQLDPVLPTRVGAPKPPPSAKVSELPGFSKANGGAWSRHAEDLLGMTRPADKLSRR